MTPPRKKNKESPPSTATIRKTYSKIHGLVLEAKEKCGSWKVWEKYVKQLEKNLSVRKWSHFNNYNNLLHVLNGSTQKDNEWWIELETIANAVIKKIDIDKDSASQHINIYPHRKDEKYLTELLALIEKAEETAIEPLISKEYSGITYERCIEINFSGLDALTLLGFADKDIEPARRRVQNAFRNLISSKNLKALNEGTKPSCKGKRTYVRIRILLGYVYSGYVLALIKAEFPDGWRAETGKLIYDFHISDPLTITQIKRSGICSRQRETLEEIAKLCTAVDTDEGEPLLALGRPDYAPNTIQVRFNVIPGPLCSLIINGKTVISDSYMYAKKDHESNTLSMNYPIAIIDSHVEQFSSVKQNFYYLWRHDLTLFDSDASELPLKKNKGRKDLEKLAEIRVPRKVRWKNKIQRIEDRRNNPPKGQEQKIPDRKVDKIKWVRNLTDKFDMWTTNFLNIE